MLESNMYDSEDAMFENIIFVPPSVSIRVVALVALYGEVVNSDTFDLTLMTISFFDSHP